jgi:ABC-2 type transport system ATP-binding protein
MMLGLVQPTAGAIQVLGRSIPSQIQSILPAIGYMSQHFSLYNDLTVLENLRFYGQAYGIPQGKMAQTLQNAVELSGLDGYQTTPTKELSGGWRQRLALSAAILHQPQVLFLDEPTAGVDPVSRRAFWDLLYKLVEAGITVFITTHYLDEAEHCHQLAFIQRGKIIALGSPAEIKSEVLPGSVLEIESNRPEELLTVLRTITDPKNQAALDVELYGAQIHVLSENPTQHIRLIKSAARKAKVKIHAISIIDPSLEDVFIACMRKITAGGNHEI